MNLLLAFMPIKPQLSVHHMCYGKAHCLEPQTKVKKVSNLFFVGGSTIPGIGLPMCLISAELAFERITGKKPELPL